MHPEADQDRRQQAQSRADCDNGLPLPRNKRKFSQRHLILRIEEAAAFINPARRTAGLGSMIFGQLTSSSSEFKRRQERAESNRDPAKMANKRKGTAKSFRRKHLHGNFGHSFALLTWMRPLLPVRFRLPPATLLRIADGMNKDGLSPTHHAWPP
jgi:hypothetical protein